MSNPADLRAAAREAERHHEWTEAARLWDALVAESGEPGFWERFYALRAVARAGRLDEAHGRLEALDIVPGSAGACALMHGEIEERRGRHDQAVEWWRAAAAVQADPYWAHFGLARSLRALGRIDDARRAMAEALRCPSAERLGASFAIGLDLARGCADEAEPKFSAFGFTAAERSRAILGSLPGMTTLAERWALHETARTQLSGAGAIVDLGCWLGSLTVALALGAEGNRRRQGAARIHVFDSFVWNAGYMDEAWKADLGMLPPADGETFFPVFERLTRPWSAAIDVHRQDLAMARWTSGPIELLSIDAMKSPALARSIVSEFYPPLLAGAVLFHQDFCDRHTWWIHILHFLLRDHFALRDPLEGSSGVLFSVARPFAPADIARAVDADLSDAGLAAAAFQCSMELVAPSDRSRIEAIERQYKLEHPL